MRLRKGLVLNFKEGEKVKVSPVGDVIGLDGRGFKIDGETLVNDVKANKLDIVLDANHDFDKALGWFAYESFEARGDGVYATLVFTPDGEVANTNKSYRYLSPVYVMGDGRTVAGLDSVGFVNRPNLLNDALNTKKETNEMTMEELKADIDEKIEKVNETLKQIGESITAFEENTKELAALKQEMTEVNAKMSKLFGKGAYETNTKGDGTLEEKELNMIKMLGIPQEAYQNAKGGK